MANLGLKQKKWVVLLATFFYLGKFPKGPGTMGTFGAIPFALLLMAAGPIPYALVTALFILFSIYIAQQYENLVQKHDCKEIVIDEVAGFLVSVALLPASWVVLFLGFCLFRFFDILKPFPISYLDKNVTGGFGVVVDDLLAGLFVNIILQALLTYYPDWLHQGMIL